MEKSSWESVGGKALDLGALPPRFSVRILEGHLYGTFCTEQV